MTIAATMYRLGLDADIWQQVEIKQMHTVGIKNAHAWRSVVYFRLAVTELRKRARRNECGLAEWQAVQQPSTETDLTVHQVLAAMSDEQRLLILRADQLKLSMAELSELYEVNISTIKTRISRARAAFKRLYLEMTK